MMLEKLWQFLKPETPSDIAFYIIFLLAVVYLVSKLIKTKSEFDLFGLIKIKPGQGDFKKELTEHIEKNDLFNRNIESVIKDAAEERKEIRKILEGLVEADKKHDAALKILQLDSLKTLILLQATKYERKCYLYDVYKEHGGNSWMDDQMEEFKEQYKRGEIK